MVRLCRKILIFLLILPLALPEVRAAETKGVSADQDSDSQTKYLALTFDDGPSGRFTERLLDGLLARQAKATFFLCGYRVEQFPDLPDRILAEGHEIGLHGYSHDSMGSMSPEKLSRELEQTSRLLQETANCQSLLLRPPGGQTGGCVEQAARDRGLSLILWSVDPRDWATSDSKKVVSHVVSQAEDGDIILLHDMSDSSVSAALELVDQLQAQGFSFVTVSRLAQLKGASLQPGETYCSFP